MKNKIFLFVGFLLILICNVGFCTDNRVNAGTKSDAPAAGFISIHCSPDLHVLTSEWAHEFEKTNPGFIIKIRECQNISNSNILNSEGNLAFLTNESFSSLQKDSIWWMVVGRDAVVPLINSNNPLLKEINEQGVSSDDLNRFFTNTDHLSWGSLLMKVDASPLHYYSSNNKTVNSTIASFINRDQIPLCGITEKDEIGLITSIQKDPYGFGFCRLKDLLAINGQNIPENIQLLPIDKNGNGQIDNFEKIYRDKAAFMHGVWVGKYPASLCMNIYSASLLKPESDREVSFLKWVLTDGQQFLNPNGYFDLANSERDAKLGLLTDNTIKANTINPGHPLRTSIFILIAFFLCGYVVIVAYRYLSQKKRSTTNTTQAKSPVFDEKSIIVPAGLYFDKSHTWAFMEMNGKVRIGIDDFIQHITGPVSRIKMKNPGEMIAKGEKIFSIIQNGKQLTIHSPVSGTIISKNEILTINTSPMNASPYDDGWVYLIEPANWIRETQFMFMAEKYREWLKHEFLRVKDFFAASLRVNSVEYATIILQDGGELKDNILAGYGPEVWEDFQTKFIDTSI